MSVTYTITLKCDGRACFKGIERKGLLDARRGDVEALRREAPGWERFRVVNTGPNGDYCPDCAAKLHAAKREALDRGRRRP